MSDKDRAKKDGQRTDKKNQAMREAVADRQEHSPAKERVDKNEAKARDGKR
jgi:hypothetical protein